MSIENFQGALSWDSQISQESSFIVLPAGEYNFKVDKMNRGQYNPSPNSKIRDVSPKAELEITIFNPDTGESTSVTENLILHSATEWKLSEFFIAIGQKNPGEPFNPNWQFVPGATGRCEVEINKYTNKEGQDRENNRIKNFLAPSVNQSPQQPVQSKQPTYQAPTTPPPAQTPPQQNPSFNF